MKRNVQIMMGIGLVGGIAGAGYALMATTPQADPSSGRLQWQVPEVVARGEAIYVAACASCHGANLEGQADWQMRGANGRLPAPPHDPTGHTWHHPDEILITITTQGTAAVVGGNYESDMMGFGDALTETEIIAVLSYIKSTWPPEVIEIHNQINVNFAAQR